MKMKYMAYFLFQKSYKRLLILAMLLCNCLFCSITQAQNPLNIKELNRAEIMNLTYEQLLELPMDDLLYLSQKMGISMDDLLTMKLNVSSKSNTSLREQPGIVTVYMAEDLEKLGLRDLTDLLRLVQGFNIGFDCEGVLGASLRGIWSYEGKILFLVDGMEINDILYTTTAIGNHFPIDQIKRVEIIRGPGSSIYGGSAEMGVVNIITKSGEDLNGIAFSGIGGFMIEQFGHYGGGLHFGRKWKNLDISILSDHHEQNRSESNFTDFYNYDEPLKEPFAHLSNDNINIGIKYKDLTTRLLYDNYETYAIYGTDGSYSNNFRTLTGDIKYDYKPSSKLCITPKFNYINSIPWDYGTGDAQIVNRITSNLSFIYDLNKHFNFVAGGEYYNISSNFQDGSTFYNGNDKYSLYNTAIFGQSIINTSILNTVLGARYEMNSFYGNAFAPRIGINRIFGNFHFKLLYSKAFRSPSIGNIIPCDSLKGYNSNVKPEKTNVAELELGYRIGKNNFITINFFDITIHQPLVYYNYYVDSIIYQNQTLYNYNYWGYENLGQTGSRGFDLDFQSKYRWGSTNIGYSFYTAKDKNDIETFAITGNNNMLLGNPQHKLTLSGSYKIISKISFSPSLIYYGATNAYTELDTLDEPVLSEIDACLLANLMIRFENFPIRNMNIDIGVYDMLDKRYPYIEPYNGYYPPFPGGSREFVLKIKYLFKLKE